MISRWTFIALLGAMCSNVAAQQGSIEERQFVIEKQKTIVLPEVNRSFSKIPYSGSKKSPLEITFDEEPVISPTEPVKLGMRILTLKQETLPRLFHGHIRAGLGNYASTYVDASYGSKRSDKWMWETRFMHQAAARGPVKWARNSDNSGEAALARFGKYGTFRTSLGFHRQRINFYGFLPEQTPSSDDTIRQRFQTFYGKVGYQFTNKPWQLKADYSVSNLTSERNTAEWLQQLSGTVRHTLNTTFALSASFHGGFATYTDSLTTQRNLIGIRPIVEYRRERLLLKAGGSFAFDSDTLEKNTGAHVYPYLEVLHPVFERSMEAFFSLSGGMKMQHYHKLVQVNPFMAGRQPLINQNDLFDMQVGIRGNPIHTLQYSASIQQVRTRYLMTFVNDFTDRSRFQIRYEDGVASLTSMHLSASYQFSSQWNTQLTAKYTSFNMDKLSRPWHIPATEAIWNIRYKHREVLNIEGGFHLLQGIYALNFRPDGTEETIVLGLVPDFHLHADYLFSNRVGIFIQFNNLLAVQYQVYQHYPVRGFHALGGLKANF
jgi:hypothetical protein